MRTLGLLLLVFALAGCDGLPAHGPKVSQLIIYEQPDDWGPVVLARQPGQVLLVLSESGVSTEGVGSSAPR